MCTYSSYSDVFAMITFGLMAFLFGEWAYIFSLHLSSSLFLFPSSLNGVHVNAMCRFNFIKAFAWKIDANDMWYRRKERCDRHKLSIKTKNRHESGKHAIHPYNKLCTANAGRKKPRIESFSKLLDKSIIFDVIWFFLWLWNVRNVFVSIIRGGVVDTDEKRNRIYVEEKEGEMEGEMWKWERMK